ncbi:NAD-binding protein [Litorivicinus lipolyticus]|uniref:NAD-binding protein n=1 Tax=Litorivicinus lipolyticus TaxID=418701 RepID=A0A5Q2Q7F7_9GAMM|nr:NAD(P)-dependent oxidoreductase [Litorivicinus lipolyticus]QGG80409.1 NAD-binding protein [Litorivicinus lipolyticus]
MKSVGIIGLGNMGVGMAANLQRYCAAHGQVLRVFDLDREKVRTLSAAGAHASHSVAELAADCDLVMTSLPSAREINAVAEAIFEHAKPNTLWLETSTNNVADWHALTQRAPAHLTLVDAPITGGFEGARDGTLTMLLGGHEDDIAPIRALLGAITQRALVMGPSGAGYVTKLAQLHLNYLVAQGIGEALMLGAKAGLALDQLHDVLSHSCAQSYVVDAYVPRVLDGSYDPSFALGLARKDMRLICELGDHLGVDLELGKQVLAAYEDATERFGFEAPHLSILKRIEDSSETELRA